MLAVIDKSVTSVQLTHLKPDGSGKAGTEWDKFSIGMSAGRPIMLAPLNDLLGLAITEGLEDALAVHQATGLGAWAAGGAARFPALAQAVPDYLDAITIFVDADPAGQTFAPRLCDALRRRGLNASLCALAVPHADAPGVVA